ncbi:hypothetical protein BCR37DRAFT_379047 [Protomyces lactucae-debilis]|uniref:Uncharacterized protein n=1 Tax=Protomyces lactucae-debilis TaxID=2754530 RepID=A0A1Y2FGN0_PROLT|nr:uncharacterized protein BCR37DRAFT_379047 [Protomyces lactucae-debilis]ORY83091.1 hypothetical protein BCR37DRAFT_379047 [Protomyces lactucae-debilis]
MRATPAAIGTGTPSVFATAALTPPTDLLFRDVACSSCCFSLVISALASCKGSLLLPAVAWNTPADLVVLDDAPVLSPFDAVARAGASF